MQKKVGDQRCGLGIEILDGLPGDLTELIGRAGASQQIDQAWRSDRTAVIGITAPGGTGKSVLVRQWLSEAVAPDPGKGRIFVCQLTDSSDRTTSSSNLFVNTFLALGDAEQDATAPGGDSRIGSEDRKAILLRERLREQPTILVLDNLETLQQQFSDGRGRITDETIRRFLVEVTREEMSNAGALVVVTSREPLPDLEQLAGFESIKLDPLSPTEGARLLKGLGITGTERDLREASRDYGGNALALVLLAGLIRDHPENNHINFREELSIFEKKHQRDLKGLEHAERVMEYYRRRAGTVEETVLLRMMGLFHRAMSRSERDILIARAAFAQVVRGLGVADWTVIERRLLEVGLLAKAKPDQPRDIWDCHPLVRERFRESFEVEEPEQWQQAQRILFEHLRDEPAEHRPQTRAELVPLYRAIHHACRAGSYREALEVYKDRIMQGPERDHAANELGALSEDSAALRMFFQPGTTELMPGANAQLSIDNQAWLQARTAFCLTCLGRLTEAIRHREAELDHCHQQETNTDLSDEERRGLYKNTANAAGMLSALHLLVGEIPAAIAKAEVAIRYADQSLDWGQRARSRCRLGAARHMQGQTETSAQAFADAVGIHRENEPQHQILNADHGFAYRARQLDTEPQADYQFFSRLLKQAESALDYDSRDLPNHWLVAEGLGVLSKASAMAGMARLGGAESDWKGATTLFEKAERLLIDSGTVIYFPELHLEYARFSLLRDITGDAERRADLALLDAEGYGMPLYQVDALLLKARLLCCNGVPAPSPELDELCGYLADAAVLIDRHVYGRRIDELNALQTMLGRACA